MRGWTLQELIGPYHVTFYAQDWTQLGTKHGLVSEIHKITSIDTRTLWGPEWIKSESIGSRMSWAARRETTRDEDQAYCLMGIFDVNMPLLYGEGGVKAFIRLQEEILKTSSDHTLFTWTTPRDMCYEDDLDADTPGGVDYYDHGGFLAHSPREFLRCCWYEKRGYLFPESPYDMTNLGLRITLPTIPGREPTKVTALLNVNVAGHADVYLGILLELVPRGNPRNQEQDYQRLIHEPPIRFLVTARDEKPTESVEPSELRGLSVETMNLPISVVHKITMRTMYIPRGRLVNDLGVKKGEMLYFGCIDLNTDAAVWNSSERARKYKDHFFSANALKPAPCVRTVHS